VQVEAAAGSRAQPAPAATTSVAGPSFSGALHRSRCDASLIPRESR
jgi:hypothetical protein